MYLSNQANRFLNAIVREYRHRCRSGNGSDVLFTFRYPELKRFRRFPPETAEMCVQELSKNGLIRKYADGGFAIIPETIAFYDEKHKGTYIRILWFAAGAVFTALLDLVVSLLDKLADRI